MSSLYDLIFRPTSSQIENYSHTWLQIEAKLDDYEAKERIEVVNDIFKDLVSNYKGDAYYISERALLDRYTYYELILQKFIKYAIKHDITLDKTKFPK